MRSILVLFTIICLFSCGNERELQLPQIEKAPVSELQDVSAAYLFYDETKPDSVDLNRKNLISTTNWLVNVDKRLTLKQAIPHIKFLQSKKESSSHKNQKAKNYFTCHDLSKNNLGFLEFTNCEYYEGTYLEYTAKQSNFNYSKALHVNIYSQNDIELYFSDIPTDSWNSNLKGLVNNITFKLSSFREKINVILSFDKKMTFQDYITVKSELYKMHSANVDISKHEFIY
ncbi:hypothetical protein SAMN05421824_2564 [Hyunsoonleella jejuensis]|uniref:Uncharacterized protein n=1 Tax=Hyunsoonleella jejuensis TaxID=419940 RepID=A0A1H9JKQ0_9FLAO|nr:hypothetical protein [Hyunsoonleella jejuensis]SEQ87353.1 hypothetical protein SAMN05421824_2564 [Hyunsoonleella jejuensis]